MSIRSISLLGRVVPIIVASSVGLAACGSKELSNSESINSFSPTASITPPPPPPEPLPPIEGLPEDYEIKGSIELKADMFRDVLGTFDSPAAAEAEGWVATGDFVAAASHSEGWQGVNSNQIEDWGPEWLGDISPTTCELGDASCDPPQGTLTSPPFEVTDARRYVNFLFKGGKANVGVRVLQSSNRDVVLADFRPEVCGPPVITGEEDWYHLDLVGSLGETVVVQIYDEDSGGCGFIAFDHFYFSDIARGALGAATLPPLAGTGVDVSSAGGNRQNVIPGGDFDDATATLAAGWEATGAFANPDSADAWVGRTAETGVKVEVNALSTCEIGGADCATPTGELSLTRFIDSEYLNFLISGGDGVSPVGIEISDLVGNVLASYTPNDCNDINGNDDWKYFDTSALINAAVKIRIFDEESNSPCGFVSADHLYKSSAEEPYENVGTLVDNGNLSWLVEIPSDAFDQVVGDFEDSVAMRAAGWSATGSFVAEPLSSNDWNGNLGSIIPKRVGSKLASTCELNDNAEGCDGAKGTLTSPAILVTEERPYLNVLFSGGADGSQPVGLKVLNPANGLTIREHLSQDCNLFGPSWVTFDLSDRVGTTVVLEAYDEFDAGCGFMTIDHVHMSKERADEL